MYYVVGVQSERNEAINFLIQIKTLKINKIHSFLCAKKWLYFALKGTRYFIHFVSFMLLSKKISVAFCLE